MGKIRTRIIGLEDVEEKQKKEQKARAQEKKIDKKKAVKAAPVEEPDKKALKKAESVIEKVEVEAKDLEKKEKPEKKAKEKVSKQRTRGKKYQQAKKLVENGKNYSLEEALVLLEKIKYAGFDESVELHLNLVKEGLRGELQLPNPTGKQIRVAIVNEAVLGAIEEGKIDFDILITEPSYMPKLARFAKVLGPRGLMPNPKTGTISDKPQEVAKKFTSGAIRWKGEAKAPLAHLLIGKASFDKKKLAENVRAYVKAIGKPNIEAAFIKVSMSPSVPLNLENI